MTMLKGDTKIKEGNHLVLNSGDEMPVVGFGTWKVPRETCADNVYNSLKNGYKLLDCASAYEN